MHNLRSSFYCCCLCVVGVVVYRAHWSHPGVFHMFTLLCYLHGQAGVLIDVYIVMELGYKSAL